MRSPFSPNFCLYYYSCNKYTNRTVCMRQPRLRNSPSFSLFFNIDRMNCNSVLVYQIPDFYCSTQTDQNNILQSISNPQSQLRNGIESYWEAKKSKDGCITHTCPTWGHPPPQSMRFYSHAQVWILTERVWIKGVVVYYVFHHTNCSVTHIHTTYLHKKTQNAEVPDKHV